MTRSAALTGLVAILAILPLTGALAAQGDVPNAANLSTQQASRSIALENRSGTDITQANVQTTDGKTWNLAKGGGVSGSHGADIVVPARDCIANVSVTLKNGQTLRANGLNACNNSQIVVNKDGISIPQIAIPGAKQKATPG